MFGLFHLIAESGQGWHRTPAEKLPPLAECRSECVLCCCGDDFNTEVTQGSLSHACTHSNPRPRIHHTQGGTHLGKNTSLSGQCDCRKGFIAEVGGRGAAACFYRNHMFRGDDWRLLSICSRRCLLTAASSCHIGTW